MRPSAIGVFDGPTATSPRTPTRTSAASARRDRRRHVHRRGGDESAATTIIRPVVDVAASATSGALVTSPLALAEMDHLVTRHGGARGRTNGSTTTSTAAPTGSNGEPASLTTRSRSPATIPRWACTDASLIAIAGRLGVTRHRDARRARTSAPCARSPASRAFRLLPAGRRLASPTDAERRRDHGQDRVALQAARLHLPRLRDLRRDRQHLRLRALRRAAQAERRRPVVEGDDPGPRRHRRARLRDHPAPAGRGRRAATSPASPTRSSSAWASASGASARTTCARRPRRAARPTEHLGLPGRAAAS